MPLVRGGDDTRVSRSGAERKTQAMSDDSDATPREPVRLSVLCPTLVARSCTICLSACARACVHGAGALRAAFQQGSVARGCARGAALSNSACVLLGHGAAKRLPFSRAGRDLKYGSPDVLRTKRADDQIQGQLWATTGRVSVPDRLPNCPLSHHVFAVHATAHDGDGIGLTRECDSSSILFLEAASRSFRPTVLISRPRT